MPQAELDHLQAALDVAAAVGEHLAVLAREQSRQLVHVHFQQALELEHHARAPLRIDARPVRCAALAPATASSSLAGGERDCACTVPVLGSKTSPWRPELPATRAPSMKCRR
jgi:hypothetical protein